MNNKTNVNDILEIKYPMLALAQIKLYLKKWCKEPSQILFIIVHVSIMPIKHYFRNFRTTNRIKACDVFS
jgi:ABC-type metal ion transport system substrate-binding protein